MSTTSLPTLSDSAARISIENLCPTDDKWENQRELSPLESRKLDKRSDGSREKVYCPKPERCIPNLHQRIHPLEKQCSPIFHQDSASQTLSTNKTQKLFRSETTHNLSQDSALSRKRKENFTNTSEPPSNLSQDSARKKKNIERTARVNFAEDPAFQLFLAKVRSITKPPIND